MRLLEHLDVELDRLPDDPDDLDRKHIDNLVELLSRGTPLPPVRLNAQTEVVQGWHRIAAHRQAGRLHVNAIRVEYIDEDEQEADTLEENLFRRKYKPADERIHLARLVKLRTALRERAAARAVLADAGSNSGSSDPKLRGRPETAKGGAIRDVAKATGRSESTVKRAAAEPKPEPIVPPPPKPPLIETRIKRLIEDLDEAVVNLQGFIDEINPKAAERRDLEHALSGRPYSFTAEQAQGGWTGGLLEAVKCLRLAVEGIERARKKQRLDDFAPPQQKQIRRGLGGRPLHPATGQPLGKLDIEVDGEPWEPADDTEPPEVA